MGHFQSDSFAKFLRASTAAAALVWGGCTAGLAATLDITGIDKDSDLYETIHDTLTRLYPRLSIGAYVIFDDFKFTQAQEAIFAFRAKHSITSPLHRSSPASRRHSTLSTRWSTGKRARPRGNR